MREDEPTHKGTTARRLGSVQPHSGPREGPPVDAHLEARERGTLNSIMVIVMHVFVEVVAVVVLNECKRKSLGYRYVNGVSCIQARRFSSLWQDQLKIEEVSTSKSKAVSTSKKIKIDACRFIFKTETTVGKGTRWLIVGGCFQASKGG
eukprot:Sro161_g072611.3  (149) ;mRNA; f:78195-78641